MYAYNEQTRRQARTNLYVVPHREFPTRRLPRARYNQQKVPKKKKKINSLIHCIRLGVVFSLLFAYIYFVFPTCFNNLIKNVIAPSKVKINTKMPKGYAYKNMKGQTAGADLYSIAYPITNYLSNDLFLNRMLLTPTIQKTHSEVTTMYLSSELTALKNQLLSLMKQYPSIHPSVYVWEYENGRYVDINGEEQFSAASIIKLPILVRMFKSIEANQMTIYDEMTLTDYYKASGSGDLQYMRSGTKYSMDSLAKTMIQDSDNSATNMIMSKMGGMDDVNIGLRDW